MANFIQSLVFGRSWILAFAIWGASLGLSVVCAQEPGSLEAAPQADSSAQPAQSGSRADDPADPQRVTRLIRQLGAREYWTRRRAAEELRRLGFAAFDALSAAETDENLEIASAARSLVRDIRIHWTEEGDPEEVRELLRDYEQLDSQSRLQRMRSLVGLLDGEGLSALCRLARFEKSHRMSKQAAVVLLQQRRLHAHDRKTIRDALLAALGESDRPAVTWLRTYARLLDDPREALPSWSDLVEDETQVLHVTPTRSGPEIVLTLLQVQVEILQDLGQTDELHRAMEKLLANQPAEVEPLTELFRWLTQRELWESLDDAASRWAHLVQQSPVLNYAVAAARAQQGQTAVAQALADQAFELRGGDATSWLNVAQALQSWGCVAWSEREYRRIIETAPYSPNVINAQFYLASMLHDAGEDRAASEVLKQAVPKLAELVNRDGAGRDLERILNEMQGMAYYYESRYWASRGDTVKQTEALQQALKYDGTNADVLIALYRLSQPQTPQREEILGRIRETTAYFRNLVDQFPRNSQYYNQLAWLVSNTEGDQQAAVAASRKSLQLRPNTAGFLDTLGRCYYAVGDLQQAIKYQRLAVTLDPASGLLRRQLEFFLAQQANR